MYNELIQVVVCLIKYCLVQSNVIKHKHEEGHVALPLVSDPHLATVSVRNYFTNIQLHRFQYLSNIQKGAYKRKTVHTP